MEFEVKTALLDQIAIVLHGWLSDSTHFVDSIANYPSGSTGGYRQALFPSFSLGNGPLQNAVEHVNFLKFVVQLIGEENTCVAAVIGEDENMNRALERWFASKFVNRHSHSVNLTITDFLKGHSQIIDEGQALRELCSDIPAKSLRWETLPFARLCNMTR